MKNKSRSRFEEAENLPVEKNIGKDDKLKNSKTIRNRLFGKDLMQQGRHNLALMADVQSHTVTNPEHHYRSQIIKHILSREVNYHVELRSLSQQPGLSLRERGAVVYHIQYTCDQYNLRKDTLYLSVYLLDRYLTKCSLQQMNIVNVANACLLISSKYEEIYPPRLQQYSPKQNKPAIIQTQAAILKSIDFDLTYTSPSKFLQLWVQLLGLNEIETKSSQILLDICLFNSKWLDYSASMLAASSISIASRLARCQVNLTKIGCYVDLEEVQKCSKTVFGLIGQCRQWMKYVKQFYQEEPWRRLFSQNN